MVLQLSLKESWPILAIAPIVVRKDLLPVEELPSLFHHSISRSQQFTTSSLVLFPAFQVLDYGPSHAFPML